jgi:hypothetical protein
MNDDEVEDRLRDALRQFAGDAPPGASMLTTVTTESARRGRRARLATFASGAAALIAIGAAVPFALRGTAPDPDRAAPAAPATSWSTPAAPATSWSTAPSSSTPPAEPKLVPSTVPTSVVFPFTPPATDAGYGTPMVTLDAGRPTVRQSLTTGVSISLTAYEQQPPRPTSKATSTQTLVKGQTATVYEWSSPDDDPTSPRRSLVWHPAPGPWLRLDADPGVGPPLLTKYAEAVQPGGVKAQTPFAFKLMPSGWTVDNITPTVVTFAPPGVGPDSTFVDKIAVQLDESPGVEPKIQGPETVAVDVSGRRAWLSTMAEAQFLQIPVEGGHSLLLQVGPKAALPQELLLRFAETITVTPGAQVSKG